MRNCYYFDVKANFATIALEPQKRAQ